MASERTPVHTNRLQRVEHGRVARDRRRLDCPVTVDDEVASTGRTATKRDSARASSVAKN
jgi:hypothetical protein